jgi:2-polyprenyl-3-methyl-5-hydroxy-6-metoxy-1,4-benzoquinol methylase
MSYKKIEKCLCCDNDELDFVLDLNSQPLANSYLKNKDDEEDVFPLGINYCPKCTHIQLTHAVDPDLLFKDYLYVSGTTKTLRDYFDWFSSFTNSYTIGRKVLDIACNDGSQLDAFTRRNIGFKTYGIDPAENLFDISSKNHNVICDYLTEDSLKKFDTKFDIIIAQNVFAHNTYPKQFLELCKTALNEYGRIFIQTSQADMVKNNQFDTIYHEHISFFSVKSFCTLAKNAGLSVIDVVRTPIHGTSFVFVLSNSLEDKSEKFIAREDNLSQEVIVRYVENCKRISNETFNKISELRELGYKIIGYGAAAKGNTFLNFSKFQLDYILDDNPLKHNMYSPGSKIKIVPPNYLLNETGKICIVPLAWNFFDEIKEKVLLMRDEDIIFLKYFPEVEISQ